MSSGTKKDAAGKANVQGVTDNARRLDDLRVRFAAVALIVLLIALAVAFPARSHAAIDAARTWVTKNFSWYFILLASGTLLFTTIIAFSKYGKIKLGGAGAKPQFSRFAWYSMLFACGQGIGLIFWSVAEPIMVQTDNPIAGGAEDPAVAALGSSYFHWAITAWAIYCSVAVCLAYSVHNRHQKATFRGACEDILPPRVRRSGGMVIEFVAILTTVFGISTSFGFAALQFTSGLSYSSGRHLGSGAVIAVIAAIGIVGAISVFFGIEKGMKRISELNSILSIVLVIAVFCFGPTLYLLHLLPESVGSYIHNFVGMSFFSDAAVMGDGLSSWKDAWVGWWSVFIWCWCFAFSPFVSAFIASISRGRSLREFIFGVIAVPSFIVIIWINVIGGTALHVDGRSANAVSTAVSGDPSSGLFEMTQHMGTIGAAICILATVLVATYFVTSLDSGVHALSSFVSMAARPSPLFRVTLVGMIVGMSVLLVSVGGDSALETIQTGTIVGALPFTVILCLMAVNLIRRMRADVKADGAESNMDGAHGEGQCTNRQE